jgi:hypothetical protein
MPARASCVAKRPCVRSSRLPSTSPALDGPAGVLHERGQPVGLQDRAAWSRLRRKQALRPASAQLAGDFPRPSPGSISARFRRPRPAAAQPRRPLRFSARGPASTGGRTPAPADVQAGESTRQELVAEQVHRCSASTGGGRRGADRDSLSDDFAPATPPTRVSSGHLPPARGTVSSPQAPARMTSRRCATLGWTSGFWMVKLARPRGSRCAMPP